MLNWLIIMWDCEHAANARIAHRLNEREFPDSAAAYPHAIAAAGVVSEVISNAIGHMTVAMTYAAEAGNA